MSATGQAIGAGRPVEGVPSRRADRFTRLDQRGSALVEFVFLAVLLMVPLFYLLLVAADLQRAAFTVTAAVRAAGRAYATAGSDATGRVRAELAAELVMSDGRVAMPPGALQIDCGGPCDYTPGSYVTVLLRVQVALPFVPFACGGRDCGLPLAVPVSARHVERLDCFVPPGGAAGSGPAGAGC